MKKRWVAVLCAAVLFALTGCQSPPLSVLLLDDCAVWDATRNTDYIIRITDRSTEQETAYETSGGRYMLDRNKTVRFRVEEQGKSGRTSAYLTRPADPDCVTVDTRAAFETYVSGGGYAFSLTEQGYSFDYTQPDELPEGTFTVDAAVKLLRITTGGRTVKLSFLANDRTDSLIVELHNAVLTGADNTPVFAVSGNADVPLILRLTGDNAITGGGNTADGSDGAAGAADADSGTTTQGGSGENGRPGYAAIQADAALFNGVGTLSVTGGVGSDGGDGGDSDGGEGGHGGDGGAGGFAVAGQTLYVNGDVTVTLAGGEGGRGGSQGDGFCNMGGEGLRGRTGRTFAGERVLLTGVLNG